jgi:hypothetical protein
MFEALLRSPFHIMLPIFPCCDPHHKRRIMLIAISGSTASVYFSPGGY